MNGSPGLWVEVGRGEPGVKGSSVGMLEFREISTADSPGRSGREIRAYYAFSEVVTFPRGETLRRLQPTLSQVSNRVGPDMLMRWELPEPPDAKVRLEDVVDLRTQVETYVMALLDALAAANGES